MGGGWIPSYTRPQLLLTGHHRPNLKARVLRGAILCKAGHDPLTTKVASVARLFGERQYGGIRLVYECAWTLAWILVSVRSRT